MIRQDSMRGINKSMANIKYGQKKVNGLPSVFKNHASIVNMIAFDFEANQDGNHHLHEAPSSRRIFQNFKMCTDEPDPSESLITVSMPYINHN